MPIFEYLCDDCGSKFEKLVRRSESDDVLCPRCGQSHVKKEYSTFSAHDGGSRQSPPAGCGGGMCQTGFCGGGGCELN